MTTQPALDFTRKAGRVAKVEVKAEPATAFASAAPPVVNVTVNITFDRAAIHDLIKTARLRRPDIKEKEDIGAPAVPKRRARPATGVVLPVSPADYPHRDTQDYTDLRVTLRKEMMRAEVMMAGAAKSRGFVTEKHHSDFQRVGMHGFYGGLDTKGLSYRKKAAESEYWDRAKVSELSYNILRLRAVTEYLQALPEVNFVQDANGKDILAKGQERQAAANRDAAGRMHTRLGEMLLERFRAAHWEPGMEKDDRALHPANRPLLKESIRHLIEPMPAKVKKQRAPAAE